MVAVVDDGEIRAPRLPILIEAMLSEDGEAPCDPPDECDVCCLLDMQRPGESRQEWGARIQRQMYANQAWRDAGWE